MFKLYKCEAIIIWEMDIDYWNLAMLQLLIFADSTFNIAWLCVINFILI